MSLSAVLPATCALHRPHTSVLAFPLTDGNRAYLYIVCNFSRGKVAAVSSFNSLYLANCIPFGQSFSSSQRSTISPLLGIVFAARKLASISRINAMSLSSCFPKCASAFHNSMYSSRRCLTRRWICSPVSSYTCFRVAVAFKEHPKIHSSSFFRIASPLLHAFLQCWWAMGSSTWLAGSTVWIDANTGQ